MRLRSVAPWFHSRTESRTEPMTYRIWKYIWQHIPKIQGSDLFDRIESEPWDLLIILDACRYDVLREICDIGVVERARSPASTTGEFLQGAAATDLFTNTTYVSANPQVTKYAPSTDCNLISVFEDKWDSELNTVQPSDVYTESISAVKRGERTVAHTLQPHYPHICEIDGSVRPVVNGLHPAERRGLEEKPEMQAALSRGMVSLNDARKSYELATQFAWVAARDVALELAEEGYSTAITSDHGELFGEWGFVEHPFGVRVKDLVSVPWLTIKPREAGTRAHTQDATVEDQLKALGYAE